MSDAPPVFLFAPRRIGDARGWFMETFNARAIAAKGIDAAFVQDNHSLSAPAFTLRGIHFQSPPQAQDKLVRCLRGRIFDVAVDLRAGSPTYGRWVGAVLSADNATQLFIAKGFGHAFVTLEPDCEVAYKVTDFYAPECDGGVAWDDPDIGIAWGLPAGAAPVLSDKDRALPRLAQWSSPFVYDDRPLVPLGSDTRGDV